MPAHESAVRKTIEAQYARLPAQHQRAADYLLSNQRTAFSMSVQELARSASVSEATLVRFARRLGFEGFLELRSKLMEEAKRELLPEDRFAYEEPSVEPAGTVAKVAKQEVENINRTIEQIDPKQLRLFVEALRRAETVATVGLGVSALLARFAAYSLFQAPLRFRPTARTRPWRSRAPRSGASPCCSSPTGRNPRSRLSQRCGSTRAPTTSSTPTRSPGLCCSSTRLLPSWRSRTSLRHSSTCAPRPRS
jgi:hypothetical protein